MAINQPPCCDVADIAPVEDIEVPQVEHSRSSSGSYIKKAVAPYTILKFGDRGEEVKQFQMVLNEFGKANLKVDGIFGKLTLKAWEDYKLVMWSIQNGSLN